MKDNLPDRRTPASEIVLYQTEDGKTRIEVRLEDNTVWLTQRLMAELFQKDVRAVNEHIGNIHAEGELSPIPRTIQSGRGFHSLGAELAAGKSTRVRVELGTFRVLRAFVVGSISEFGNGERA